MEHATQISITPSKVKKVQVAADGRIVSVECNQNHSGSADIDTKQPPSSSEMKKAPQSLSITDVSPFDLATNGPLPAAPTRASPAPQNYQGPQVPNGKPTSPYVERSNPMIINGQSSAQTVSSKDPKAAAQAASDMRNVVRRKLTGYVGFANLPNQWHRKSVRKGFNFNVMVVGKMQNRIILQVSG